MPVWTPKMRPVGGKALRGNCAVTSHKRERMKALAQCK